MTIRRIFKHLWITRKFGLIVFSFLVPVSLLSDGSIEARCGYALIAIAVLWLTGALPIYVTALLPVFLLPMLRVQPAKTVCKNYINDTSMLYLGGFIVAIAMEEVQLHKRIAIGVTRIFGSRPNTLMLGLMLSVYLLSMWVSNSAATCMMLPIAMAITDEIIIATSDTVNDEDVSKNHNIEMKGEEDASRAEVKIDISPVDRSSENPKNKKLKGGFALCVSYASAIGGIATLTGSPINIVLLGYADSFYQIYGENDSGITFGGWMALYVPLSLLLLITAWICLQIYFLRSSICTKTIETRKQVLKKALKEQYAKLGKIKFKEIVVLIIFCIQATLWITRNLPGIGGWDIIFLDDQGTPTVTDSTVCMFVASFLFIIPEEMPYIFCSEEPDKEDAVYYKPLLEWKTAGKNISWDTLFLIGGGYALADACVASGLSKIVGCSLHIFKDMEPWLMNLVLCLIAAAITEITTNVAVVTLLTPIMFELALALELHPLYLMMSTCIAASFSFMLPMASAPNAVSFSTGYLKIRDQAIVGFMLKLASVVLLSLLINTWGSTLFGFETRPDIFAKSVDITSCGNLAFNNTASTTYSRMNLTEAR